ncbi:WbqC family protein [Tardiphaga sp. vice352]|uniref:WbqC family protein n=1 Tax=Tardiphaga sp. vice352 TaxID=2592816 RepID=UPI001FF02B79|nr:WbqC family protein [Tardiphaga sp. vice352]
MSKSVVITQSNYLPWRGYFDLLRSADEIVLLDSVQYTRRDWRNRNLIKTPQGAGWITISVEVKGRYLQAIDETRISDPDWARTHKRTIELAYRKAPCFTETADWLFALLDEVAEQPLLSVVNEITLKRICGKLSVDIPMRRCTDLIDRERLAGLDPTDRLIALAQAAGATRYLTGPAARSYLNVDRFRDAGIEVEWMRYDVYPPYPQLWGPFVPGVSIIDLFFNTGADATRYLDKQP